MRAKVASHPPATYELHPEQETPRSSALESVARLLAGGIVRPLRARSGGLRQIVSLVEECEPGLSGQTDTALLEVAEGLRFQLRREGFEPLGVARVFALVREVAERTVGMRHFDCQLIGGWALLRGMVAEMETGEGKTLTATLAACAAALAGVPVHIITVNDYLTARDAEKTVFEKVDGEWRITSPVDAAASAYVREVNDGRRSIPTIVFQDGSTLVEPSDAELAAKLGVDRPS